MIISLFFSLFLFLFIFHLFLMKLIVGLGNPGKEYIQTRHNIGFNIIDDFVQYKKIGNWKNVKMQGYKSEIIETSINEQKIFFLKPMEFMNRSGLSVGVMAHFYKIDPKDILVIHDDIDLSVGKIQLKLGGSSAGHNGIKNIIEKLGTKDFWRLRIGVGRPGDKKDVADYVLQKFTYEQQHTIDLFSEHIFGIITQRIGS